MTRPLALGTALVAVAVSTVIIFLERLFPFVLFARREPPKLIRFIEKYIPSLIIAVLLVYSLKDVQLAPLSAGLPYAAGLLAAVVLHLLLKNSMVSIFGSTALFMLLLHLL